MLYSLGGETVDVDTSKDEDDPDRFVYGPIQAQAHLKDPLVARYADIYSW